MELKDFISKLPLDKIIKTEITSKKITLPVNMNCEKFYKKFKSSIKSNTLTNEKAIFVSSTLKLNKYISPAELLKSKLKIGK